MILPCVCPHVFQDVRYGKGLRVHNQTKQSKPEAQRGWRCTVCVKEHYGQNPSSSRDLRSPIVRA